MKNKANLTAPAILTATPALNVMIKTFKNTIETLTRFFVISVCVSVSIFSTAGASQTPVMKFGGADLVTPSQADSYYGGVSSPTGVWSPSGGRAPELKELARALNDDPDQIYSFVRNNIEFEPLFGMQKGALGAAIDRSGTAFDQAALMVELLREAGLTAEYRYGAVSLSGAEFESWFGLTDAKASCKFLASGGFPASINSATSCTSLTGDVTSATVRHVWVRAQISGTWYEFDPALKSHIIKAGIDVKSAMNYSSAASIKSAAMSGAQTTTLSGAPAVRNINQSNLESSLSSFAQSLITDLKTNHHDKNIDDIVGGLELEREEIPSGGLRQTSLSGHTLVSSWTDVPDAYRTVFTVGSTKFFTDEIYGRRLTLEIEQDSPAETVWLKLRWDGEDVTTISTQSQEELLPYFEDLTLSTSIDHPYAADSGDFMDHVRTRTNAGLGQGGAIILGLGDVSSRYVTKLVGERLHDDLIAIAISAQCNQGQGVPWIPSSGDPTVSEIKAREGLKTQIGYSWASQFSRAADLQARVAGGRAQHHHSFGVIAAVNEFNQLCPNASTFKAPLLGATATVIDLVSGVSVTDVDADEAEEQATSRALALIGATLEGSVFEQILDKAQTGSTVERFEWVNRELTSKYFTLHNTSVWSSPDPDISGAYLAEDYINEGKFVLSVNDTGYLGPGPELMTSRSSPDTGALTAGPSIERGKAFVAFSADASEIGHIITSADLGSKGGGAANPYKDATNGVFDPSSAADILRDTFEDRSSLHGIDLATGEMSYSPAADVSVGSGGFPYELSFQRTFSNGGGKSRGLGAGWRHNFDIGLSISGSGLEAMGQSSAVNAAASIAFMAAAQDLYKSTPTLNQDTLQRHITAMFAAHWWREHLQNNVATVRNGVSQTQFVRLPNGDWNAPAGDLSELVQTGTRQTVLTVQPEDTTLTGYSRPYPWERLVHCYKGLSFELTTAGGDVIDFDYGLSGGGTSCSGLTSNTGRDYKATKWTFASGYELNFAYATQAVASASAFEEYPHRLTSVSNSDGKTLTFTWDDLHTNTPGAWDEVITDVTTNDQRSASFEHSHAPLEMTDITVSLATNTYGNSLANSPILDSADNALGLTTSYEYANSFLNTTAGPADARTEFNAKLHQVIAPLDPNNAIMEVAYDRAWRVKTFKDAEGVLGNRGAYIFRVAPGAQGERQDPLGGVYHVEYDVYGRTVKHVTEVGDAVVTEHDSLGRVVKRTYPEGNAASFVYDANSNVIEMTRHDKAGVPANDLTAYATYDTVWKKKVASVTDFNGNTTDITYWGTGVNGAGQARYVDQPAASSGGTRPRWTFAYNADGRVTSITNPEGEARTISYTGGNLSGFAIDPSGLNLATGYSYDNAGNPTSVNGPRTDVTDVTTFVFDALRRLTSMTAADPDGGGSLTAPKAETIYDANGRVTKTCAQVGEGATPPTTCANATWSNQTFWAVTVTTYSATGQPLTVRDPDGKLSFTYYDALDRPQVTVDAEGRKSRQVYRADSKVLKVIKAWAGNVDGTGATTDCAQMRADTAGDPLRLQQCYQEYTYTDNGQIETVKDANGNLTTYEYDNHDRLEKTVFPDSSEESYAYDAGGNMTAKTARDGRVISLVYDDLGRLTTRTVPGSGDSGGNFEDFTFTYDLAGRQLTNNHRQMTIAYVYDEAGRPVSKTHNGSMTVGYQYDKASNISRLTHPDSYFVEFSYDALNRVISADESGTVTLATLTYDAASRRQSVVYANGTSASFGFTARGDLTDHDWDLPGTSNDFGYDLSYNNVGQLISETISVDGFRWVPPHDDVDTYQTNNLNQYTTIDSASPVYDDNGNITTDVQGRSFVYDAENVLRQATGLAAGTADYLYYADGTRRRKSYDSAVSDFYYDGDQEILETDGSGTTLRRYVRLPGSVDEPFLMIDYTGTGCSSGCETWAHQNRQGSVVAITDDAGSLIETFTYSPYGESGSEGDSGFPFRFTGQKLDPETGLYYYKARYYDPEIGRFLQTDCIGYEDQMNLYGYVHNDPLNGYDPSGCRSKFDYQVLIFLARRKGFDFAADNLEYFLSGKGGTRRIDPEYMLQFDEIQKAYEKNMERIESRVEAIASNLKPGEKTSYEDYWEVDVVPESEDLFYGSGSSTFTSRTFITIEKNEDGSISIAGFVSHEWTDTYDWDDGKSVMIPFLGEFDDEDAQALEESDDAAPFELESIWVESYD